MKIKINLMKCKILLIKKKKRIDILEQKSQEDKNKIDNLQQKLIKEETIVNDLNLKIQKIDKDKNENKIIKKLYQKVFNMNYEFYDSFKYIKKNNIILESVIINECELAQINNGIRRQKKANI